MTVTSAVTPDLSNSLFHRILKLWQSLPSYLDPDQFDPVILSPSPVTKQKEVSFVEYPQSELRKATSALQKIILAELIQPFLEFTKYYKLSKYRFPAIDDEKGTQAYEECNIHTSLKMSCHIKQARVTIEAHRY
jgi:hypothetical protein